MLQDVRASAQARARAYTRKVVRVLAVFQALSDVNPAQRTHAPTHTRARMQYVRQVLYVSVGTPDAHEPAHTREHVHLRQVHEDILQSYVPCKTHKSPS